MTRVKRGVVTKKRHVRLLKKAKGFWGQRKNIFRRAAETLRRAMAFSYKGRKLKKRSMRSLFIMRIRAAVENNEMKYGEFMYKLRVSNIQLNRKMLSQLAIFDEPAFFELVKTVATVNS